VPTAPAAPPQWGPPNAGQPQWGQPGYVRTPDWQRAAFRPSGGLAPAIYVLSVLYTVFTWLSQIIEPTEQTSLSDALEGNQPADISFGAAEVIGLLSLPVLFGVWIVTSIWLSRARGNAVILRPQGQRRSEGWAWFGWILPVVYLWFPKQILDDTAAATGPASGDHRPTGSNTYWTLWVMSILISAAGVVAALTSADESVVRSFGYAQAIVLTIALIPWIRLVRQISAAQDRLAADGVVGPE